jgi:hypothetical protein
MNRDPQVDKIIEMYAAYATPAIAYKQAREEFGENAYTAHQVKAIREKYRAEILEARKKLMAKIPILDAKERWAYLQQIIDGSLEGEIVYDRKTGIPIEAKVDRTSALNALKLAHEMTQLKGTLNTEDEDLIKSLVQEAFETMTLETPDRSVDDIKKEIIDTLGEKVRPYVTQIAADYVH